MNTQTKKTATLRVQSLLSRAAIVAAFTTLSLTSASAAELVVNGGFELPVVTYQQGWMSYYGENAPDSFPQCDVANPPIVLPECNGETVPGWIVFWQDTLLDDNPEPGRLELQVGAIGGIIAAGGNQKAELDGHYRDDDYTDDVTYDENVFLGQQIATCGRTPYVFSYSWKARVNVPGDNDILVLVDDEAVLTNTEFKDTWSREEYKFLATPSGESLLGFTSVGTGNNKGMLIDDVSVIGQDGSDPQACEPPPPICRNPNSLTLLYDADFSEDDFYAQNPGDVSVTNLGALTLFVQIKVYDAQTRAELFVGAARVGQTFSFTGAGGGSVPEEVEIEISDQQGELLQVVAFRTDGLSVGEEFGGVGVWDADCQCECVCEDSGQPVNVDFFGLTENRIFEGDTFAGFGVRFSGSRTTKPLMIQDTSDPDLPSASQDHYNPIQGKALTFSRDDVPVGPRELGGRQQFNIDFDNPVIMKSITTMDNEEAGSEIRVYGESGLIKTVPVPVVPEGTGNWVNSLQVVQINAEGVVRVEFDSMGSTFIDDIAYHIPCGESCSCDCDDAD